MLFEKRSYHMSPSNINSDDYTMADFYESEDPDIFAKADPLYQFISDWREKGTYTYRRLLKTSADNRVLVEDDSEHPPRPMIMMASNNYLGLNSRPEVKQAVCEAVQRYGTSMCGAPFLSGTYELLRELEQRLARFEQFEEAMVFSTGYQANVGAISALARTKDIVIIDRLAHASVVDGCRLAGCAVHTFKHNDVHNLEHLLKTTQGKYAGKLVIVEGVFSMDGDRAPLPQIVEVCKRHGAKLLVDEAHGTGVLGPNGRGTVEHFDLHGQVDLVLGTFSKSLASTGGFIAGNAKIINYIRHYARSYIFSASITPANAAAALSALNLVEQEPQLRDRLWENIRYFHAGLKSRGFKVLPPTPESAIIVFVVGSNALLRTMSREVHDANLFINSVVYPAVSKNASRLRISLSATHTRTDLDQALDILTAIGVKHKIVERLAHEDPAHSPVRA
jgi:glycine C-acetyltransferase